MVGLENPGIYCWRLREIFERRRESWEVPVTKNRSVSVMCKVEIILVILHHIDICNKIKLSTQILMYHRQPTLDQGPLDIISESGGKSIAP